MSESAIIRSWIWGFLACALAATMAPAAKAGNNDPDFGAHWHDGKAELDGYRLVVERYGETRPGRAVLIYVTEPFSSAKHVKVDDPSRDPADTFEAMKLNLARDFQTGIYDYRTIISLFTRSQDFRPVKIAFSSSEWCGQVYEELHFRDSGLSEQFFSYFEDESSALSLEIPRDGVTEDNLFIILRGLRGPFMKAGEKRSFPFLASSFHRRLTHQKIAWSSATIERLKRPEQVRVPAGEFQTDVYVVRPADGREGRFHIEQAYPHRVIRWSWQPARPSSSRSGLEGADTGELTGSARLEYWKLNQPGDEKYLEELGLTPVVR